MASSKANPPPLNLAALLIKRKMSRKTGGQSNIKQPSQPPDVTGSHSDEKLTYHQNPGVINPQETATTTVAENTSEQPKMSRKTKQLEVTLLDKKMEEINRKQEEKTNEALDTWKGFDSLNYGFTSEPGRQNSTPVPPLTKNQRTPTPSLIPEKHPSPVKTVNEPPREKSPVTQHAAERHQSPTMPRASSPKRVTSPVKDHPKPKSPLKGEEPQKATSPLPPAHQTIQKQPAPPPSPKQEKIEKSRSPSPLSHNEKPIEKQPTPPPRQNSIKKPSSPPPPPPPRRSRINSAPSAKKTKSPEQEPLKSKSPTPIIENIIPFSSIISNPQIFEKNIQPFEQSFLPTSTTPPVKLFPDIKHHEMKRLRKAHKSIQRSMDRYRFHIW